MALTLISCGLLFMLVVVFSGDTASQRIVFGIWQINEKTFLFCQIAAVLGVALCGAGILFMERLSRQKCILALLTIVASLIAAADFFWLCVALLAYVAGLWSHLLRRPLKRS